MTKRKIETRSIASTTLATSGDKPVIRGFIPYDSLSEVITIASGRQFREVIRRGAFSDSIRSRYDTLARFEHREILGRVSNGTVRLFDEPGGLRYEIDVPATTAGRDAVQLIRRRDIQASSFTFRVRPDGDELLRIRGENIRELRNVELIDVAPVSRPAYPDASVALRFLTAPINWLLKMRLALAERL